MESVRQQKTVTEAQTEKQAVPAGDFRFQDAKNLTLPGKGVVLFIHLAILLFRLSAMQRQRMQKPDPPVSRGILIRYKFQDIPRLAVEGGADSGKGRKTDCFRLVILQDGQICQSQVHLFGELGESHFPFCHHHVQIHNDHGPPQIVKSFSAFSSAA